MSEYEKGLIRTDRGLFLDKGNQVYDVRHPDFGAKGDGVTDDSAAIQAAIDEAAATAGNGTVLIPAGVVYARSSLTVPASVSVWDLSKVIPNFTPMRPFFAPQSSLEVIGHRGFAGIAPENTLASFSAAIRHGATSIEFDIQVTSDGELVIIHDGTVDRTTNGTGNVVDMTLATIQALDAGSWFDVKFTGEKIPTLTDVLTLCRGRALHIYPEIKGFRPGPVTAPLDISNMTTTIIDAGFEDNCVLYSFTPSNFVHVRALSNRITVGYAILDLSGFNTSLPLAEADGNAVMIADYFTVVNNPSLVSDARARGVDIVVYTPNLTDNIRVLRDIGITRIMTDKLVGIRA